MNKKETVGQFIIITDSRIWLLGWEARIAGSHSFYFPAGQILFEIREGIYL
jgi:hypothetical protein